ncbi:MAG TPA: metallophosphoesterase family protein [Gaiellaceae bacterium]|nr:metallophosphoesterase family protein [Gaiellaceae bacterium]
MRVAVVSDIHANLHALDAVLGDVDAAAPDEIWCLGDVVGYGASPNECCARVRERAALALCGNHDLAALGRLDLGDFSGDAAAAARWTRPVLAGEHAAWLASLEPRAARPGVELFHASPRDPVWDYVLSESVALESLQLTTAPLVLVGHSHVALALSGDGDAVEGGLAPGGTELRLGGARTLANPGSVGQPRDGDPRAAWLLLDLGADRAVFRRVPYDVEGAQAAIRAAGLPDALADRLARGL